MTSFFGAIAAIVLFTALTNWLRSTRPSLESLRPNLLLTRYPLVFLWGRRSPFYFSNFWNHLPKRIRDHGYDVYELPLPFADEKKRQAAISDWLQNSGKLPVHLIADASTVPELLWLSKNCPQNIKTITLIKSTTEPRGPWQDLILKNQKPRLFANLSVAPQNAFFPSRRLDARALNLDLDPEETTLNQVLDHLTVLAENDHEPQQGHRDEWHTAEKLQL